MAFYKNDTHSNPHVPGISENKPSVGHQEDKQRYEGGREFANTEIPCGEGELRRVAAQLLLATAALLR